MRLIQLACLVALTAGAISARAQTLAEKPYYSRVNTFGLEAAYANDSSHILLGIAENRKLLNFGAKYARRLWIGRIVNWQYDAEILPVALESDPVIHSVILYSSPQAFTQTFSTAPLTACHPSSGSFSDTVNGVTYSYTYTSSCQRQWTMGEAISPIGFQWNFVPRRRLQPFLVGHGGYMYSTQPVPISTAGSFNFTFDFGAGLELYRSKTQSIRAEYRYHHISNHDTAAQNPGIDNGIYQITYAFGR